MILRLILRRQQNRDAPMRRLCLAMLPLLLASCASVTPYQPADSRGYGYSEQRLESNRYRITFIGSGATPPGTVDNYLMLRAAEMTVFNGYDWFALTGRSQGLEPQQREPSLGIGIGMGSHGSGGGVSLGIGQTIAGGKSPNRAQADVLMYAGQKPTDRSDAFDAREVKANLEAQVLRPTGS